MDGEFFTCTFPIPIIPRHFIMICACLLKNRRVPHRSEICSLVTNPARKKGTGPDHNRGLLLLFFVEPDRKRSLRVKLTPDHTLLSKRRTGKDAYGRAKTHLNQSGAQPAEIIPDRTGTGRHRNHHAFCRQWRQGAVRFASNLTSTCV